MKRATCGYRHMVFVVLDFNPRPREEGDLTKQNFIILSGYISIHALVKRATKSHRGDNVTDGISIHALVKRATF